LNLEYLLVGVARESLDDFKEFYNKSCDKVYGFALSFVKDRIFARDVMIEVYRRVYTLAYAFDTDMNAEFWLMDMTKNICINSMHDAELRSVISDKKLDNGSKILIEVINDLISDRAQIVMLKVMSTLSDKDIAKILWYRKSSIKAEYNRAIRQLIKNDKKRKPKTIKTEVYESVKQSIPDAWPIIISKEQSHLHHISHEELNLEDDELIFSQEDSQIALDKKKQAVKEKRKTALIITLLIAVFIAVTTITYVVVSYINNQKTQQEESLLNIPVEHSKIAMVTIGDNLYYQNVQDNNYLYVANMNTGVSSKLCEDNIKELKTDGNMLYYRTLSDCLIYSILPDGSARTLLSQEKGTAITLYKDWIYFSDTDGIYRMKKTGENRELLFQIDENSTTDSGSFLFRYDIEVYDDIVYFSAGSGKGLYYLSDVEGETVYFPLYSGEEIYSTQIENEDMFFDILRFIDVDKSQTWLYKVNLEDSSISSYDNVYLGSAAYDVVGDTVYYQGYSLDNDGNMTAEGIYSINVSGENQTYLFYFMASDMLASDDKLVLYDPLGTGTLRVYDKEDNTNYIDILTNTEK